jgi:hypothetical protein
LKNLGVVSFSKNISVDINRQPADDKGVIEPFSIQITI